MLKLFYIVNRKKEKTVIWGDYKIRSLHELCLHGFMILSNVIVKHNSTESSQFGQHFLHIFSFMPNSLSLDISFLFHYCVCMFFNNRFIIIIKIIILIMLPSQVTRVKAKIQNILIQFNKTSDHIGFVEYIFSDIQ